MALGAALEGMTPAMGRPALENAARAVVRAYLGVETDEVTRRHDKRLSALTKQMAAMEVGDRILTDATATQVMRARMKSARRLMDNQAAVFGCDTMPSGKVRVERLEDGASAYKRRAPRNAKAEELASLQINQEVISKTVLSLRGKGQMGTNTKIAARKLINAPGADWAARRTPEGILLKRIC